MYTYIKLHRERDREKRKKEKEKEYRDRDRDRQLVGRTDRILISVRTSVDKGTERARKRGETDTVSQTDRQTKTMEEWRERGGR